ncbi:hypothetical protein ERO13_D12G190201v2 [Gossypium hirsutum]|nr:hypothetical protein ERO13_D12G190201v2 [Gossypium hirsutum]
MSSASELPEPNVQILTSSGVRIPAHFSILAMVSPVLDNIMERPVKHGSSERVIPILGVPCDAVTAFIKYLYNSMCTEEQMEKYGIHLLVLSHVYLVPQLKQRCSRGVSQRLTVENAVDVLQLARLCDVPDLYLKCLKQRRWRQRKEQRLYLQLSDGLECLEHICREGCTTVGPYDVETAKKPSPCDKYATCQGVQMLIKHLVLCKRRASGVGCCRCNRMWQLLRLHSSICDHPDSCRVPLYRQFKWKAQQKMGEDAKWKLLVKKVCSAKAMLSLSLPKRKREEELKETMGRTAHALKTFRLY